MQKSGFLKVNRNGFITISELKGLWSVGGIYNEDTITDYYLLACFVTQQPVGWDL